MSQLSGNQKRAAMAAAIYLTLPGQPYIYYGEEIGMMGQKPDEAIRECLNWNKQRSNGTTSWREPHYNLASSISIEDAIQDTASLYHHYKSLIALRNSYASLLAGTIESLPSTNQVLAYSRTVKNESLIIVHNISDTEQNYSMNTYKVVQSLTLGKKQNISDNKIPPFTTLILTNK
jgi:glycosidase